LVKAGGVPEDGPALFSLTVASRLIIPADDGGWEWAPNGLSVVAFATFVRDAVLEEAVKACERVAARELHTPGYNDEFMDGAGECAAAIRALKGRGE
jgi:hypothetical protein